MLTKLKTTSVKCKRDDLFIVGGVILWKLGLYVLVLCIAFPMLFLIIIYGVCGEGTKSYNIIHL